MGPNGGIAGPPLPPQAVRRHNPKREIRGRQDFFMTPPQDRVRHPSSRVIIPVLLAQLLSGRSPAAAEAVCEGCRLFFSGIAPIKIAIRRYDPTELKAAAVWKANRTANCDTR